VVRRLVAEPVTWRSDLRLGHDLAPTSLQPVTRYRLHGGTVTALDWKLDPSRSVDVDVPATARLLTATPRLGHVVAADAATLIIWTARGARRVPLSAADSATVLSSGHLLVTAPVIERQTWQGRTYEQRGAHRVFLVELRTGRILDEAAIDVVDAGVTAVPHPHDASVLLDAGEGQDGSRVFRARVVDDRLALELVLENVVAAGFAPSGHRMLITPHPSFDDRVSVLAWPSLHPIASITAADVGCVADRFDLYGCFLSENRVLLKTVEHGLMLCSADLRPDAWIELTTNDADDGAEIETVFGVSDDAFAAEVWNDRSASATVWRIPR
jgi:hypothetical protein